MGGGVKPIIVYEFMDGSRDAHDFRILITLEGHFFQVGSTFKMKGRQADLESDTGTTGLDQLELGRFIQKE
jgi:hypothetical protein